MPTYPTEQERVEAHEGAAMASDYAGREIGETTTEGILHEIAAQVHWLAAETRSLRLEVIAMNAIPEPGEVVSGQRVGSKFVPEPPVEVTVPDGDWREIGVAGDLAFNAGSTAGYPRDVHAIKITRADGPGECFVTAEVWQQYQLEREAP